MFPNQYKLSNVRIDVVPTGTTGPGRCALTCSIRSRLTDISSACIPWSFIVSDFTGRKVPAPTCRVR